MKIKLARCARQDDNLPPGSIRKHGSLIAGNPPLWGDFQYPRSRIMLRHFPRTRVLEIAIKLFYTCVSRDVKYDFVICSCSSDIWHDHGTLDSHPCMTFLACVRTPFTANLLTPPPPLLSLSLSLSLSLPPYVYRVKCMSLYLTDAMALPAEFFRTHSSANKVLPEAL